LQLKRRFGGVMAFTYECLGFVVNIYNTLNYDIDLIDTDIKQITNCFGRIITNEYTYLQNNQMVTGLSYRCRLAGIMKKQSFSSTSYKHSNKEIVSHIDKLNGWVLLKLHGSDKYNRLVISAIDPVSGTNIVNILKQYTDVYQMYNDTLL
jgi:hypothetical protein